MMVRNLGKPIRVILQSRQDEAKLKTAGSKRRGLDPEPWYSSIDGESVFLQRGSARASPLVSLDGEPMIRREPTYSLRESRPDQVAFRERVSAKSSGRCAMTSAPGEVCDAAHFPWADWRKDNGAHHGALLRKDIHAALDRGLISIDQGGRVSVSTELASAYPAYGELHGTTVPL
ncbi:MAG: hypothetical protein CVV16_13455 [Gammaproteobacteria bacterium HGW-Gammaproteobacteria-6]|nr:MAG: hypothetical protein CVV16_13455 [Gammaproteobacteria bacterium HGW-Gammaproteobacteria-6]